MRLFSTLGVSYSIGEVGVRRRSIRVRRRSIRVRRRYTPVFDGYLMR
jgi:hypothetical protein